MARYIDLDKLLKGLEDTLEGKNPNHVSYLVFKMFISRLNHEPTADVVPKSEVETLEKEIERLKHILDSYALQYGTVKDQHEVIEKAKAEVAREIFEEIFNIIRAYEFDALTAKNNYGIFQVRNFGTDILKIKKKYTEEKT